MSRFSIASLERWFWYMFLATCAWQTRIILWQADRVFIEWRSVSLYASDMLMFALFACAAWQMIRERAWRRAIRVDASDIILVGFLFAAVLSVHATDEFTVSVYQLIRLAQFILLYFYVRYRAIHFDADTALLTFVLGALFQSGLAIGQYALQHDIGLRWLGETLLDPGMKGVAVFYDLAHIKILRAYGTLPHPNVLAAYLMAGLWALSYLYLRHGRGHVRRDGLIWGVCGAVMLWALYLTYSRTMIIVGVAATVALVVLFRRFAGNWSNSAVVNGRMRHIAALWIFASVAFGLLFWQQLAARALISPSEEAVQLRVYYAKEALASGANRWLNLNWTGVGIGNFVGWLHRVAPGQPSWMYQPAHNLYLLVYSETGILGVGLFLAWLMGVVRSVLRAPRPPVVRWGWMMVVASFLLIALFDHFFWTLQQGRILWWMVMALAVSGV